MVDFFWTAYLKGIFRQGVDTSTERMRQRITSQRRKPTLGRPGPEGGLKLGVVHGHGRVWVWGRGSRGGRGAVLRLSSFDE